MIALPYYKREVRVDQIGSAFDQGYNTGARDGIRIGMSRAADVIAQEKWSGNRSTTIAFGVAFALGIVFAWLVLA